ncbi:hypothetical protein R1flu_008900 [Riccia fluitans]|uniref:Uncharacterized protein n=1 Tax=Riccia fluitans TaxID=41844 RepID=A0ABD1Z1C8_9MARC
MEKRRHQEAEWNQNFVLNSVFQLLQDIASRLSAFLQHLEAELAVGSEALETSLRFFAYLVGPFYPILTVVGGRETEKSASSGTETDLAKSKQPTVFTVSSNFQGGIKKRGARFEQGGAG